MDEIEPAVDGLMLHVTFVLLLPVSVEVNCCVWPLNILTAVGETLREIVMLYSKFTGTNNVPGAPETKVYDPDGP